jgi:hypothetical protein
MRTKINRKCLGFFHGINTLLLSYNMYIVVQFSCMTHLSYLCKLTSKKLFIKDVFCLIIDTLFWLTYLFGFYGVHYNRNMIWKFIISVFPCFYSRVGGRGKGGGERESPRRGIQSYTLLYLDYTLSMFIYCTVLLSTKDIFRNICTRLGSVHNPCSLSLTLFIRYLFPVLNLVHLICSTTITALILFYNYHCPHPVLHPSLPLSCSTTITALILFYNYHCPHSILLPSQPSVCSTAITALILFYCHHSPHSILLPSQPSFYSTAITALILFYCHHCPHSSL